MPIPEHATASMIPAPMATEEFAIGDWTYFTSVEDLGDEGRKIQHFAVNGGSGDTREIDLSPYKWLTLSAFEALIRLDFHRRTGTGPLTNADILAMEASKCS